MGVVLPLQQCPKALHQQSNPLPGIKLQDYKCFANKIIGARIIFGVDVATAPVVRKVPQTFHARTLSRVGLYISFNLSI
jgi:hypothetical protein